MRLAAAAALALCVVAAAGAAVSSGARRTPASTCPRDAALGVVHFARGGNEYAVSLADCVVRRATPVRPGEKFRSPSGLVAAVRVTKPKAKRGSQAITVDGRVVYRVAEDYRTIPGGTPGPIILVGWSPDSRWILFAIDPMGSASLAADGLGLEALDVASGRAVRVTDMLTRSDYLTWCGSTLVLTAGGDRLATTNKRLVAASAPDWKPHTLWPDPKRAFSSVTCAPDGKSLAVLSQPASLDYNFFHTRWQLWRVSLNGSHRLLDAPPAGFADESPRWSRDGSALLFVRERKGYGQLMLLRNGSVVGPIAELGFSPGYYGSDNWWLRASWSAGA